jgi:GNAT superfamily N-acetyltransferase
VTIARLADCPEDIDQLACGFEREWPEWYGVGRAADARKDLTARMNRDVLPLALVAREEGQPLGTLTISPSGIYAHPGLAPTIVGFWVTQERRNNGIGARLLAAARDEARKMNLPSLYASTASAASLFLRCGWHERGLFDWRGERLMLLALAV